LEDFNLSTKSLFSKQSRKSTPRSLKRRFNSETDKELSPESIELSVDAAEANVGFRANVLFFDRVLEEYMGRKDSPGMRNIPITIIIVFIGRGDYY
jgi:hypothetical protein